MTITAAAVRRTYYVLGFGNSLAASLIWGINTIFLLDAGLTNLLAFAANAFFTAGMVLFEVPTGVVADAWGRRASYLLGTLTLAAATGLYVLLWQVTAGFWWWAVASVLLGLGFTFFSGAVEAWLIDALAATGHEGPVDPVFARGQVFAGVGTLLGSVGGGYLAQVAGLGAPFVLRVVILVLLFGVAALIMRDLGFTPDRGRGVRDEVRRIVGDSVRYGWRVPSVRYLMLAAPFSGGAGIFVFYALQPYLLQLWGDPAAYGIAGLVAAIVAGSQIIGGLLAPLLRRLFHRRSGALIAALAGEAVAVLLIGLVAHFWAVLVLIVGWGLLSAAALPVRQAYLNGMIPSKQRATILSFDSLMNSTGGVVFQPVLGRVADVWSYPASYLVSGVLTALAVPFVVLARRQNAPADR
jgi:MFS family permease